MWQEALLWQSLLVGNSLRYPPVGSHSVGERQKGCGGTSSHGPLHRTAEWEGKQIAEDSDLIKLEP